MNSMREKTQRVNVCLDGCQYIHVCVMWGTRLKQLCSTGRPHTHESSCLSFQSPGILNFVKPRPDVCVTSYVLQDSEFYYLERTQKLLMYV